MHMLRRQLSFHLFNHTNHAKINRFMEVNFFAGVGGYVDSTEIGKCEAAVNWRSHVSNKTCLVKEGDDIDR